MKRIFSFILLIALFGCSDFVTESQDTDIRIEFDTRLNVDDNGYYHLQLDNTKWQTLHRLSGNAYKNDELLEGLKIHWWSSHYWYIEDTLGYIVSTGLTDDLMYVSYDTNYVTWFDGFEVPTVNLASYSNRGGEFNTMFAPTRNMSLDSVTIVAYYWNYEDELIEDSFVIVLDE